MDPNRWKEFGGFKEIKLFVITAKVINDRSERGVKLIQDISNVITSDSEERRHLLKSVELSRGKYLNFKKSCLNN